MVLKGLSFFKKGGHIIISSIEHPCIVESAAWLEKRGFKVTRLKVDRYGTVDLKELEKSIEEETFLVSIIHGSNEIGTIQPIDKIGAICRKKNVYFHTDASQTFSKIPIDVEKIKIDLLTASSHKIYGPKGAAFLYKRKGVKLEPLIHGGGQENGLRSSTLDIPSIVGFAKAVDISIATMKKEENRIINLREKLIKGVLKIKGTRLNGHPKNRLANNANFSFSFIEGESIAIQLDLKGIAVSTGSACSSTKLEPSHVLLAIGLRHEDAHGSLRVTLGRWTKEKEVDYFLKILPGIIKQLRKISPFYEKK
jgi:cysteine desulfurase